MEPRFASFAEFWPFYLKEHSHRHTRSLHYIGTTAAIAIAVLAAVTQQWIVLAALPLAGYAFAWAAHLFVQKNRPATFTHPLWSLLADFKMWWLWLTRRLGPELERAGIERP